MFFEEYVIDFLKYLKEDEGFLISEEAASSIFVYINENDIKIEDEYEIMSFMRPLLCTNSMQYNLFPEIFRNYIKIKLDLDEDILREKQNREKHQKNIERAKKELEDLKTKNNEEKKSKNNNSTIFDGYKNRKSFLSAANKNKKSLKTVFSGQKMTPEEKDLLNYLFFDEKCEDFPTQTLKVLLKNLEKHINGFAFKAALAGDKGVIKLFKETKNVFEDAENVLSHKARSENVGKYREEEIQKKIDNLLNKVNACDERITQKKESLQHRRSFVSNGGSVQSDALGELSSKRLSVVKDEDVKQIEYYIKKNARFFKTKMSRNIQTASHTKLDIKTIIKEACATDGIPLRLAYKKRVENKPKLVLMLDVSGSCMSTSKMMLLFMYYLKQVFTGGCDAYVFVNSLYDVTFFMNAKNPESAIDSIMSVVKTKGVYSDYHRPFKTFYEDKISTITKDSIVIFIGDARNNNNPTGEEYLKAISRKARACFWLNTEDTYNWDAGDSIIGIYSEYMQQTLPILTVGQLVDFITNFKLRRC